MRSDDLVASWSATEADLRWVLNNSVVPGATAAWIEEFLDHNELGLAYELLVDALVDPSDETRQRLRRAAGRMGMQADDIPGH